MERIEHLKKYLLAVHPVRRSAGEKAEFRKWLLGELRRTGWRGAEETYGKFNGSVNVVSGDPEKASVFLCAHYDTAARPLAPNFVSPTNPPAYVLYHLAVALVLVVAAFLAALAVSFPLNQPALMLPLFVISAVALLGLAAYGPANKFNANGNTSGVLTLLAIAEAVKRDKRVCLVFLDNNERNLLGASAFRKKHPNAAGCLVINFDCVGAGEHLLLMPSKNSRWDGELLDALGESFRADGPVEPHVLTTGLQYYPSDHRKFKFHVAVCACQHLAGLGYYIPHLGTKRDTELSEETAAYIARSMADFLPLYFNDQKEEDPT